MINNMYMAYGQDGKFLMSTNSRLWAWLWLRIRGTRVGAQIHTNGVWFGATLPSWIKSGPPASRAAEVLIIPTRLDQHSRIAAGRGITAEQMAQHVIAKAEQPIIGN